MDRLNYHHLLYFWLVAKEGGVARAGDRLGLSAPTISGQVRELERSLGERLFRRAGRGLALSEAGHVVYRYADEIFSLGREMLDALRGRPTGRPLLLMAGAADVLPKMVVRRLLDPALRLKDAVRVVCREDKPDRLLADLALHALDVVFTDAPLQAGATVRAYHHLLGECAVEFYGAPALARRFRRGFPASLEGAPVLLPTENTAMRRSLEQWFEAAGVRPRVVAEMEDSALLKAFGQDGLGLFPAPAVLRPDIRRQHGALPVGAAGPVRERFYAVTVERRLKHPAVVAICDAAREKLFSG